MGAWAGVCLIVFDEFVGSARFNCTKKCSLLIRRVDIALCDLENFIEDLFLFALSVVISGEYLLNHNRSKFSVQ